MHTTLKDFRNCIFMLAAAVALAACDDEHVSSFSDAVDVCVGVNHSCAVHSSGRITCWGSNFYGESDVPNRYDFTAVSCSSAYTCGLKSTGEIQCWGEKLSCSGTDTSGDDCSPTPAATPPKETGFIQLAANDEIACALRKNGTTFCWGDTANRCFSPPDATKQYIQIDGDGCSFCGLEKSGKIDCKGNEYLESPADVIEQPWDYKPLPEDILFSYIAVEGSHACGIQINDPSRVYCWGQDTLDQLYPQPTTTWNSEKIPLVRIDSNDDFRCILRKGKGYTCFGQSEQSLGYPPNDDFIQLALRADHGCGILQSGHVRCWGDNYKGKSSPP